MEAVSEQPVVGNRPLLASGDPPAGLDRLSLRWLLVLGFGGVLLLLMVSGLVLTQRLAAATDRGAEIRQRFLGNNTRLSAISNRILESSVHLRDALLSPAAAHDTPAALLANRDEIEQALDTYELRDSSNDEGDAWLDLERELRGFWTAVAPFVEAIRNEPSVANASLRLDAEVIPKRQAIMGILDRIQALNEIGFRAEQSEITELRAGLNRQVWQMTAATGVMGFVIAFLAIRQASRLETRIREQHARDIVQRQALAQLPQKLMAAQEEEGRRIARELHDEIGQALGAIKLELAIAEKRHHGPTGPELAQARAITDSALESVRQLSRLLHPSMLDDFGLPDTAATYLQHFQRRTGIHTELQVVGLEDRVRPELEVCAYRVVQEAVTNVGRHAGATQCYVRLERSNGTLQVMVTDNGVGFAPMILQSQQQFGLGLTSLRERVTGVGGWVELTNRVSNGAHLKAVLPLEPVQS
jgi:signal transduction histidine kinase